MRDPLPPAPASDEMLATAPEFIVAGTWDDAEWRAIAKKPSSMWTEAEKYIYVGGPRPHPWGRNSYTTARPDGVEVTFPNKGAYDTHMKTAADTQASGEHTAQNTLNALNAGLAAHAIADSAEHAVKPASHPEQAAEMLEAAAPNGTVAG